MFFTSMLLTHCLTSPNFTAIMEAHFFQNGAIVRSMIFFLCSTLQKDATFYVSISLWVIVAL